MSRVDLPDLCLQKCPGAAGVRNSLALTTLLTFLSLAGPVFAGDMEGKLQLSVVDAASGELTPARVQILGADGGYHVAEDALLVGGDCDTASINDRALISSFIRASR